MSSRSTSELGDLQGDDIAVLDNLSWQSLSTVHARFAEGGPLAKRFDPEVAGFAGIVDTSQASWDALAELLGPGQVVTMSRFGDIEPPEGWERIGGGTGHQMVLTELADAPPVAADIVPLDEGHVPEMLALIKLAQPGPFRPRTIELGNYLGVFEDDRLVAMAGERLQTARFTEVSAVCTHPDARGRGLAAALSHRVATGIIERRQRPMLHVSQTNTNAQRVYERLGFVVRTPLLFVALRTPAG